VVQDNVERKKGGTDLIEIPATVIGFAPYGDTVDWRCSGISWILDSICAEPRCERLTVL
jgi:hypothetical protein